MSRDAMMVSTEPLYEFHGKDGQVWRAFEDGRAEGFPPGTVVLNRATSLLDLLRARIVNLERACVSGKETETTVQ